MAHRLPLLALLGLLPTAACDGGQGGNVCRGFELTVGKNEVSAQMATVGVVEWSLTGAAPSRAKIVYRLQDAPSSSLNQGGEAPVDLGRPNYRTLLLGLKQSHDYTFHIEATRDGATCVSADYALPTTGSFPDARPVTVDVVQPDQREPGFIVTSSGTSLPNSAFIIDADGDIVWYADGPLNTTRAQMDYATVPLLHNVLVLATGERRGSGENEETSGAPGPRTFNNITVSVDPEEAELLVFAMQRGPVNVALRSQDDVATFDDVPEKNFGDIFEQKRRADFVHRHAQKKIGELKAQ